MSDQSKDELAAAHWEPERLTKGDPDILEPPPGEKWVGGLQPDARLRQGFEVQLEPGERVRPFEPMSEVPGYRQALLEQINDRRLAFPKATCNNVPDFGIGAGHVCRCGRERNHETIVALYHGCSCGAEWE